jgi:phospholipase/lecithinase/hemolysin
VGNQLGNPPLPGWTTAGGLNWIGNLVSSNVQLLSYNLASGGATTDANLVTPFAPTVLSLVDQVKLFTSNLSPAPAYAPWTAADSLFGIWIGVNDVGNAWYKPEWPTLSKQIVDRYFEQVQALYNAGGRNFVFLTVPPIDRAPSNLGLDDWGKTTMKAAIATYNDLITAGRNAFVAANPGVFAIVVDIYPKFALTLDNPTVYGAVNSTCFNADGKTCLWWNDYHPGLVLQNGVADDVAVLTGLYL